MFKEITATLLDPKHDNTIEFNVDIDVDTGKADDVYTDLRNYDYFPPALKRLTWKNHQNKLFIHSTNPEKAWAYLKKHAHYDLDE